MKVLMTANVETVIVLRSCAPLCVSFTDYCFHQRALPSRRSVFAMIAIFVGASVYVYFEQSQQQVRKQSDESQEAYAWLASWFALLIFQLTYGKQLVTGLGLHSTWSPVLYTNALALVPTAGMGYLSGDYDRLKTVDWTVAGVCWLLLSCVAGVAISWAGFKCQQVITATAYTVVGVMNKLLTVLVNVLIWDKHASPLGIAALCVCLCGGALYEQAPLRRPKGYEPVVHAASIAPMDTTASADHDDPRTSEP